MRQMRSVFEIIKYKRVVFFDGVSI